LRETGKNNKGENSIMLYHMYPIHAYLRAFVTIFSRGAVWPRHTKSDKGLCGKRDAKGLAL